MENKFYNKDQNIRFTTKSIHTPLVDNVENNRLLRRNFHCVRNGNKDKTNQLLGICAQDGWMDRGMNMNTISFI